MEPFIELVVNGPLELGLWSVDVKPVPGTLWKQAPHTARFIAVGITPFTRDFCWNLNRPRDRGQELGPTGRFSCF